MLEKSCRLIPGLVLLAVALSSGSALACSICQGGGTLLTPTFRQEAALPQARLILHGTIDNPRLGKGDFTRGQTDFHVKTILRSDPAIKGKETLVLSRYLPVNKGETPHYLLFCDVDKGKIDPYRGIRIKSQASADYVKKALALTSKDQSKNLEFYFRYLDDPDPEVARDAFLEFAKASDSDIGQVAPRLSADKLRAWMKDAKTPPERLGVYALLLGSTGKQADADYLRKLLDSKDDRYRSALGGVLAGYMKARPKDGWVLAQDIVADGRKSLTLRLAAVQSLRFYQGSQPKESKPHILKVMKKVLAQGDLADLAVEDLRRWKLWDLTGDVLKLYGQRGFDAPLMKRAIIRYALCCKTRKDAGDFVKSRRTDDPDLVGEVEEGLQFETQR